MKTKQKNVRLKLAYAAALQGFNGTAIIHEALDNSPHQPFRKELAKQKEAYGRIKDNQDEHHPDTTRVSQEFDD
jgi:hypothetical protein